MKDKQLSKLYDLMKGLLLTYDYGVYDDEELRNDVYELDRIISDRINKKVGKDDLRWCNEIWKKYKCNKLEDEIDKMVYRKEGSPKLRRTQIVLYEPTSLGYEIDDFIIKRRTYLNNDGEIDGLSTLWYDNGKKWSERTYKDGEEDGLVTFWYENGQKSIEGTFKDGGKEGLETHWYKNGQKSYKGTFKDGKPNGLVTWWYENGHKKMETTVKDGEQDGLYTQWYENGHKKREATYKDGEMISQKCWDEDGNIIDEE